MKETKKVNAKIMPHNTEAEQAVLGACLIDAEVAINVMNSLRHDDFYLEAHQDIFGAMYVVYSKNQPIDYITLTDELDAEGILQSVGGLEYITTLTNVIPSAANANVYIDIVKRDSILRRIIKRPFLERLNAYLLPLPRVATV